MLVITFAALYLLGPGDARPLGEVAPTLAGVIDTSKLARAVATNIEGLPVGLSRKFVASSGKECVCPSLRVVAGCGAPERLTPRRVRISRAQPK